MSSRKLLIVVSFMSLLLIVLNYSEVHTNIVQPTAGRTGGPGDSPGACAGSGCHNGPPLYTTSSVTMLSLGANVLDNGYTPSTTYSLSLTVSDFTKSRYGFQVMALDPTNTQAGSFTVTNASSTTITPAGGREYMSHKDATSQNAWAFNWSAPASDVGLVTFYVAANAANGDNTNQGDQIYTTKYTVSTTQGFAVVPTVGVFDNFTANEADFVDVYPNPVVDEVVLDYHLDNNAYVNVELYNINGQIVRELKAENMTAGAHLEKFNVNSMGVESGLYLVRFTVDGSSYFKKMMVK